MPTASSKTTASPSSSRGVELPPALRALAEAGWSLASKAPSARVGLARAAGIVDPEGLPGAIREPVMRELEGARDAASEPLDGRTVERALKDAWGRAPAKVLDDFDPEPFAVRAAAQTHRGVADGSPVAIRVRRPGLDRAVRADLALLDTLAAPLRTALPKADTRALLRSLREQTLDELDFEHEASTHRRVARVLRDVEGLVVPSVHGELCTETVFVAGLLDGETLADGARPKDAGAAARTLVAAHVAAARAGIALSTPGPGTSSSSPVGRSACSAPGWRGRSTAIASDTRWTRSPALRADDAQAFAQAVAAAGVLPPELRRRAHALARSALGPLAAGKPKLDAAVLRAVAVRGAGIAPAVFELVPQAEPHPDDLWLGACRRPTRGHARPPGRHRGLARTGRKFRVRPTLQWTWSTSSASRRPDLILIAAAVIVRPVGRWRAATRRGALPRRGRARGRGRPRAAREERDREGNRGRSAASALYAGPRAVEPPCGDRPGHPESFADLAQANSPAPRAPSPPAPS